MTEKEPISIHDAIGIEMCNNCSYADNYDLFKENYYCFKKMQRGNFDICENYTSSKRVAFKTWLKAWIYLLR